MPTSYLKIKNRLIISSVGKDVEERTLSLLVGGNLAVPIKIKNVHILKILLLLDLSYKNMHTSRQLFIYMNVHCSILCNIKTVPNTRSGTE